jgi:predicted ArsR family transcriptional regulator
LSSKRETAIDTEPVSDGFGDMKKKILWNLKSQGEGGLDDLARTLKISRMAVHKHLVGLEERGLVESSQVRKGNVGRPRASYRLTSKGNTTFPRSYGAVATCALKFIERKMGRKAVEQVLRERQTDVFEKYQRNLQQLDFGERVGALAKMRDDEGYMAEAKKLSKGKYVLFEYNCPIIQLAQDYWEACTTETELFQNLLGAKVETTHRAAKGDLVCRFVIEKAKRDDFETSPKVEKGAKTRFLISSKA